MKPKHYWLLGISAFVVLSILALVFGPKFAFKPKAKFKAPIEQINFANGLEFKVIQVGESPLIDGEMDNGSSGWRWGSTSTRGFFIAGVGLNHHLRNEELVGIQFNAHQQALVLECLVNRDGRPAPFPWIVKTASGLTEISGEATKEIRIPGQEAFLEVYMADSAGNWQQGNGPIPSGEIAGKDELIRSVVTFPSAPRSLQKLHFKVECPGEAPKEFEIDNPNYQNSSASLTSAPLPTVESHPDFELTLKRVEITQSAAGEHFLKPYFKLTSSVTRAGNPYPDCLNLSVHSIKGDWGGELFESTDWRRHRGQYFFDPENTQFEIVTTITPSRTFPSERAATMPIAELIVQAGGKLGPVTSTLSPFGIQLTSLSKGSSPIGDHDFKIEYQLPTAAKIDAAEKALPNWSSSCPLATFVNGEHYSSDRGDHTGHSGSESHGLGRSEKKGSTTFGINLPKNLKPGDQLTFALAPEPKPYQVTFTVDRKDFTNISK